MRAIASLSPSGPGKQRLLTSCAIAAGMMALAYGGPTLAQVAGSGTITTLPSGTTVGTGVNPSTVNVNGPQSIVDWTPSNTPVAGVIDFLPTGNTLDYVGDTTGYVVLNRFVDGAGTSITDQIALNGIVNSYVGSTSGPRGGNIWFYNAGGILIGASGVINVGSLVLTTNDIVTTGGLFGPGGTIRFNGTAGSTSAITVNGAINANNVGNPGSSYIALVAPRVVQAGTVRVDGSAAYVAAEQADIRINGGLFDINVTRGVEGGNAITHTGTTTGPAHQDGDTDQSRIYMVAIPKNDAVTMLVSGAIGYDDAVSATEEDGAIRLSAGYNITSGEQNLNPVNATAANIIVNDTLFRSSTVARASGTFVGEALQQIPGSPPPLSSAGQIFVEGNGVFSGDAGASLTIGAGQQGGATGNLTVRSDGAAGAAGNVAVNVTGGTLSTGNLLQITSLSLPATATGDSQGGTASLTITGGTVTTPVLSLSAIASADIGTNGLAGNARGGTASISVSNSGTLLDTGTVLISASAFGPTNISIPTGGDAQGGTATLTVSDGASFRATNNVSIDANGSGGFGPAQAGNGTGGTARIEILGSNTAFESSDTSIEALGTGGSFSGPDDTLNGGDGTGGSAALVINSDNGGIKSLGTLSLDASGRGGDAGGENSAGGDALGGTASLTADGGATAQFASIALVASAEAGIALSPSGTTGQSGNARGNNVTLAATNGSTISSSDGINLFAVGMNPFPSNPAGENFGSGTGGNVAVSATAGGTITTGNSLIVQAMGGNMSNAVTQSAGNGVGGNVDFLADGGTIVAEIYRVDASSSTAHVVGTGGSAQGGTIDLFARNGGEIRATLDSTNELNASATSGSSAAGTAATGGTIQLIADGGRLDLGVGADLIAGGTSGGATTAGAAPTGTGGTILIQTAASSGSAIDYGQLSAAADGRTAVEIEVPGGPIDSSGNGRGGTVTLDVRGGTVSGGLIELSANGSGRGASGGGANGTGGTATFTQTGGDISISDMSISADGLGGIAQSVSGTGTGGVATIDLSGGTITAADIIASANGEGRPGTDGNDDDPANIIAGGTGGAGVGGNAVINIGGTAVVDASVIEAYANGTGGTGGGFNAGFGSPPGTPGNGGNGSGGTASVNLTGGSVTASSVTADASGIGGQGGSSFFSSSSGSATGVGVGGRGGIGRGGRATIGLAATSGTITDVGAVAQGTGGLGGAYNVGGAGGDGYGGIAQAIVDDFDAGTLAISLDSTAEGGDGGDADDGRGGDGGNAFGGTSSVLADGPNARVRVTQANFVTGAAGGNGGDGRLGFSSSAAVAPSGGDGGSAQGGAIEVISRDGATMTLGLAAGDVVELGSTGIGGNGGNGSTADFGAGNIGGDGGLGGGGVGGSVRLIADGGTITTAGESLEIDVSGQSGTGGNGGLAGGGGSLPGTNGGFAGTAGGRVNIDALTTNAGPGLIDLGNTNIFASGDTAGRVEIRSDSRVNFTSLDVEVRGLANPTNNDTDTAPAGIFLGATGGTIEAGSLTLGTDGSIGLYAAGAGRVTVGETAQLQAGDQIDIRHDLRGANAAPTIEATDDLFIVAGTSISGAPGSLLAAGATLSLTGEGAAATIGVDRLDAADITISSSGAASIEHAEAVNDFTANAASFRTGLNSIITGGDISITSPGAVDLGNSTAGGFVQVQGQSIAFNSITAGLSVGLSADGTAAGAEGIRGGSIAAGEDINLFANSIALTGNVTGAASFFAFGTGGAVAVTNADVDGNISIFSAADLSGTYVAGGNIFLNSDANINASAQANGGYVDRNGIAAEGNLFVIAAGNATLTDSSAARMFGVNAGVAASIDGGTAGEDVLVIAGTTASLTDVTGGDDITVRAAGNIDALNVRTTGAGADTHILDFSTASGSPTFTIGTGEGSQGINGADIVMASTAGAIGAATLSAGDDILLNAANNIAVNGATTLGLGTTGGDSSIRTQGGATTLAGLDAFSDVVVDAAGIANLTGTVAAGRNATITAQGVTLAALTSPGGSALPTLSADGDVAVNSSAGITGGGVRAAGNATLTAGTAIGITSIEGQDVTLTGATGVAANQANALGTTSLDSSDGNIQLGSLIAGGTINASANAIRIESGGDLHFATLTTDVGDAYVRGGGDFSVATGTVAGTADLRTQGEAMTIGNLTAANAVIENSVGFLNLDTVTVAGNLTAAARASLGINGVVTGQSISLASAGISIAPTGRVGTAGVTRQLSVANNNTANQTFVGGIAGPNGPNGYHIDADELTRLYGTQIEIFAPEVQSAGPVSVGSATPPDVVVDTFTMTGGASNANLGANGALTIRTPGKMRVIGNVQLTGLTDANALNLAAGDALEVILGRGSVRLLGANNAPGGQLNMASDDIIVATEAAITAVGAATTTDAINTRLGQNDGVTLDEGALFARGIRAEVVGGFYVQNSGAGTDFAQRRGLTFGAGGLDVRTQGTSRIVINGVQLGAGGQITGIDTVPLLTIGGAAPVVGSYDRRSTFNGCLIASPTACTTVTFDFENNFPVQDIIDEEVDDDDGVGEGNNFPQALITMRDIDPMTGEPLLDDPVTGAGNDDLWTPPQQ
ncbi:beta strand repeat-containing protein [Sphingopyxis sp. 22461]|uniref:beta strand repeat-containing protein n=1 Tax=Sphingopyxis sp. 22461 TaxID=3453923 RepID=UPI003F8602EE